MGDPDGTVTYSFTITPTTSGDLVISIPAGAAKDALDNQKHRFCGAHRHSRYEYSKC